MSPQRTGAGANGEATAARGRGQAITRRATTATIALSMGALLFATACTGGGSSPLDPVTNQQGTQQDRTPPQRVLQAVDVSVGPDGAMNSITGTTVSVRQDPSQADTTKTGYNPQEVAGDLPARVLVSYRTKDRVGTNLQDLAGYTGRVEINLNVENLTVKPRTVTYDVSGERRTRTALVGVPLTVVASTVLEDTPASSVITASAGQKAARTNGVLAQSEQGKASVQWGAILAPPQVAANAQLKLVLDAQDFTVPSFDVTVQPGLVTDPSVSGLLESSFSTNPESQLALQRRTITLITEVNEVLAKASGQIGTVRKNLDSTSRTLGAKSVSDLNNGTKSVASSVKGLDAQLSSLSKDLNGSLTGAQDATLQQLAQTVSAMDQILGDTSAGPVAPRLDGEGCQTVVAKPGQAGSVYGNLMQVSGQLEGWSAATGACKGRAEAMLRSTIGPAEPTPQVCRESTSVTCTLMDNQLQFAASMADLVSQGEALAATLQPEVLTNTQSQFAALSTGIDEMIATVDDLDDASTTSAAELRKQVAGLEGNLKVLSDQLGAVRGEALYSRKEVDGRYVDAQGNEVLGSAEDRRASMAGQVQALADEICRLVPSDEQGNGATQPAPAPDQPAQAEPAAVASPAAPSTQASATPAPSAATTPGASESPSTEPSAPATPAPSGGPSASQGPAPSDAPSATPTPEPTPTPTQQPSVQPSQPGNENQLTREEANRLRAFLTTTGCPPPNGQATNVEPAGYAAPLSARLATQANSWTKIITMTSNGSTIGDTMAALKQQQKALAQTEQELTDAVAGDAATVDELSKKLDDMATTRDAMKSQMETLQKVQNGLAPAITEAFSKAAGSANQQMAEAVQPQIRRVATQTEVDAEALGEMFDRSANGLHVAATAISQNGTRTIAAQREDLAQQNGEYAESLDRQIKGSLSGIASSVSSSTRDLTAAGALLQADLNKVLLDLGDPRVKGSGLLGAMETSAATVGSADYQLALAQKKASSYANVRSQDVEAVLLRQAQLRAATQAQAEMKPFRLELPAGTQSQTVYHFHVGATR